MILNETKNDVVVGGQFKTSSFKIQASAKAFDILSSNIYTHKVRAVIREISCNAHDAHVASNNQNQFDVHLPTKLEPWFSVRDYGKGLSDDQVREIFTTYFFSTKTNSNEYVGALGLGSKSPFCLVDSFNVVSYHNNVKSNYVCFRDENGEPQISLLTQCETDEPSGLEVSLSVSDHLIAEFLEEAIEVYQYFENLPNINISTIVHQIKTEQNNYKIKTNEYAFSSSYGNIYAVMGNVCYNIPEKYSSQLRLRGYVRFNIGELSFDPGRENLSMDTKTIAAIEAKMADLKEKIVSDVMNEIRNQPTEFKKSLLANNYRRNGSYLYGYISSSKFKDEFDSYLFKNYTTNDIIVYSSSGRSSVSKWTQDSLFYSHSETKIFLQKKGYDTRIKEWVRNNRSAVTIVNEEHVKFYNIDPEFICDLETLPKVYRARSSNGKSYKDKVFKWNGKTFEGNSINMSMVPEQPSSGENVYVVIERNRVSSSSGFYSLGNMKKRLDALKEFISIGDIYLVKSSFLNTKQFKTDNWISLQDYISRELDNALKPTDKIYRYSGEFKEVINNIAEYMEQNPNPAFDASEFIEFRNIYACTKQNEALYRIYDFGYLGADRVSNELDIMEKNIVDKYSVFKLISTYVSYKNIPFLVDILEKTCLTSVLKQYNIRVLFVVLVLLGEQECQFTSKTIVISGLLL